MNEVGNEDGIQVVRNPDCGREQVKEALLLANYESYKVGLVI